MSNSKDPKLVAYLAFSGMVFQAQNKTLLDTEFYNRIYKVPSILSISLRYIMFVALVELAVFRLPDWPWYIFFTVLLAWAFVAAVAGVIAGTQVGAMLSTYRVRNWLNERFRRYSDMDEWVKNTNPLELELAVGLPDEAWEVDHINGGIKINPGHEHHLTKFKVTK